MRLQTRRWEVPEISRHALKVSPTNKTHFKAHKSWAMMDAELCMDMRRTAKKVISILHLGIQPTYQLRLYMVFDIIHNIILTFFGKTYLLPHRCNRQ